MQYVQDVQSVLGADAQFWMNLGKVAEETPPKHFTVLPLHNSPVRLVNITELQVQIETLSTVKSTQIQVYSIVSSYCF